MKIKEIGKKLFHKKSIAIAVLLVVALAAGSLAAVYFVKRSSKQDRSFRQGAMEGMNLTQDMIAASGVTNVGITEEAFAVENLAASLEIEEVYVASNDEVEVGTKILKLSEDSVAEARKELERTLQDAELAYRTGAIEYKQNRITAEYDRDSASLSGEQAKEVYDETVESLQAAVTRAEEELQDARDAIAEYESYVNDSSYSSYFKVDEYQATYDTNLEALSDKLDEWGISWSQVTGAGGQAGGQGNAPSGNSGTVSGGDVTVLSSLYSVLEQNRKDLEQAQNDYEDAVTNAAFQLQTLQLKLPSLEQAVVEAQENYDTQIQQAKLTYETALASAERAQSDYETAIEKTESDYSTLQEDYEDAKENLELFENSVGDGYFYASGSGTILRIMVRAGDELTSEGILFVYSNPEELTVTVSVDQSSIAQIALGDTAYIQSAEYGGFTGKVTELNPVSASSSRTSVTYDVTVKVTDDTGTLPANESVTVVFGMEEAGEQGTAPEPPDGEAAPERSDGESILKQPDGEAMPKQPGNGDDRKALNADGNKE